MAIGNDVLSRPEVPTELLEELLAAGDVLLGKNIRKVKFHGADADAQATGNFFIGKAVADELEDLELSGRELLREVSTAVQTVRHLAQKSFQYAGLDPVVPFGNETHSTNQEFPSLIVRQEAMRARRKHQHHLFSIQVLVQDEKASLRE